MPRCCGATSISVMDGEASPSPQSLGLHIQDGNPRNKTALAPGHSLMDWIRLGSSGIDLTGVGGVPRNVTLKELAKHNKKTDAWIAIRGIVFNVTKYMDFHPGGVDELMKGVGKDATKLFDDVHAWVNYQSILQKCVVGRLTRGGPPGSFDLTDTTNSPRANLPSSGPAILEFDTKNENLNGEEINKSGSPALNVQIDWKQTTNSISFSYKPASRKIAVAYRLTRLNGSEFVIKIHHDNTVIRHEYDLSESVNWPPMAVKNFENSEIEFSFTKCTGKLWNSFGSRSVVRETKSIERVYKEYKVISNTELCEGVRLLVVRAEDYMEIVPVGRHVEVKLKVMGMEVSRSYTPVPSSFRADHVALGYKPDCLCLMVKRYDDGALSPSLTALEQGQVLTLSNGLGTFVVESFDECATIHMLAAGTGLTPMLGIIQRALGRRNVMTINLVNFNRNEKNIFYSSELERVAEDKKLSLTHVLSQPEESWQGRRGLVTESLLKELLGISSKESCVFICGPKAFMIAAKEALTKLDWKASQIHEFDG
ncbi:cytochrome b5 reductase 4 isoform X2 [Venturia canescens]|uniref:cytochrome b5 reductase 4 isoform X2 n=1 Tax=Venturia canescens TaxID=32260 RepID=UPI001C9BC93B|nr:cytochrome b5 reductase 4 isoform X2 [Venturia canescens]